MACFAFCLHYAVIVTDLWYVHARLYMTAAIAFSVITGGAENETF